MASQQKLAGVSGPSDAPAPWAGSPGSGCPGRLRGASCRAILRLAGLRELGRPVLLILLAFCLKRLGRVRRRRCSSLDRLNLGLGKNHGPTRGRGTLA